MIPLPATQTLYYYRYLTMAVLCLSCTLAPCSSRLNGTKTPLYYGVLLPISEKDGWSNFFGLSSLRGAERAVRDINNRSDVLPEYEIVLIVSDSEGDKVTALNRLYDHIYQPPVKTALFGSLLSSVTESVGEVAGRWKILEMSPGGSSPVLEDRDKYPYIYRMLISAAGFSYAQLQLFRLFGWTNIATLHETSEPHSGVTVVLQQLAEANGIVVLAAESFLSDPLEAMQRIKAKDARIIAANFYETKIRLVFCYAYHLGLYGSRYVWIIPGYLVEGWWIEPGEGVNCTSDQLKRASEGYLTVTWSMHGRQEVNTNAGITPLEYRRQMAHVLGRNVSVMGRGMVSVGYDGIWALALAMHDAQEELGRPLNSFRYGDANYSDIVGRFLQRNRFQGVSGSVGFSQSGGRLGTLLIEQHIGGVETVVGTYDRRTDEVELLISESDLWYYNDGKPPFDSDTTVTITILQATPIAVMIVVSAFAVLGAAMAVSFITFNISKRRDRQIKMSSPKLNNLIAVGILMAYFTITLMGVDISMVSEEALVIVCTMRSWILVLAFTIAFGGMFTKMWRVYSIVIHNKTKRKVIKDRHLFLIVGILLLIDLVILISWQLFDPIRTESNQAYIPQTDEDLALYRKYVQLHVTCTSTYGTIWTSTLMIYKSFVVVFGAFLAWSTRNVNVPALNDSYYVGLSIYNTVVCCVVAAPLSLLNVSSVGVTYSLVACFMLFCTTMTLCMLFIPKLISVFRKNKTGDTTATGRIGTIQPSDTVHGEQSNSNEKDNTDDASNTE